MKVFHVVPDTNVILSATISRNETSPNREFVQRWIEHQFELLFSQDTFNEYAEKLLALGVAPQIATRILEKIARLGIQVEIQHFHTPPFPIDPDDIAFLLCAENGSASHLVTHDAHLLQLPPNRTFKICKVLPFLHELRRL